jgi:hypothetical protein
MTISEERTQILRMIQSGHITAEEGAQILDAMEERERQRQLGPSSPDRERPDEFRIRISDLDTGKQLVDFSLPFSMLKIGVKMGARLSREEIRLEDFTQAIEAGMRGRIAELRDEERRERIEIFVE